MILHLLNNDKKFSLQYISFINNNFDEKYHKFLVIGGTKSQIYNLGNVEQITSYRKNFIKVLKYINKYDKIIIHSINNTDLSKILFIRPWLLKKCYWVVWGADLYYYINRKCNIRTDIHEFFRRHVIRNMGGLITHIKGDYELAKKWYGFKGKYHYSFMYPSNLYHEYDLPETNNTKSDKLYIQVGNSADSSNNHVEVFNKLKLYKDEKIEIICPLSYGDIDYRNKVISEGRKIFGDKFKPLIEFIPFDDYLKILAKIDVAIFNHKRQQGMGNITTLLGLGKKVYIRDDISTWQFCLDHNLKVYSTNKEFSDLFDDLDSINRQNNIKNVKMSFSVYKLFKDWDEIFKS